MAGEVWERKADFWARVDREGRRGEVDAARTGLESAGLRGQRLHAALVRQFQPLDGSRTRATPDPRVDRRPGGQATAVLGRAETADDVRRDMLWVYNNLGNPLPAEAPSEGALALHRQVTSNERRKAEFLVHVIRRFVTPKQAGRGDDETGRSPCDELLDEWAARLEGRARAEAAGEAAEPAGPWAVSADEPPIHEPPAAAPPSPPPPAPAPVVCRPAPYPPRPLCGPCRDEGRAGCTHCLIASSRVAVFDPAEPLSVRAASCEEAERVRGVRCPKCGWFRGNEYPGGVYRGHPDCAACEPAFERNTGLE